jgi:hypothetical protein
MNAEWERMSRCTNNQEVGLEAATLERVRNSSLVECRGADNPTGQSILPKLGTAFRGSGRGASRMQRSGSGSQPWSVRECECRNE